MFSKRLLGYVVVVLSIRIPKLEPQTKRPAHIFKSIRANLGNLEDQKDLKASTTHLLSVVRGGGRLPLRHAVDGDAVIFEDAALQQRA